MILLVLFASTVILSGCGAKEEKEPKQTNSKETAPEVPFLTTEEDLFSSEEIVIPHTGTQKEETDVSVTTTVPAVTTTAPVTTTKPTTTTTVPKTTVAVKPKKKTQER